MKSKLLLEAQERTFVIVFAPEDEVAQGLLQFAQSEKITSAGFTAIGALREVTLGWFNLDKQDYERIPLKEQVEVVSLVGNIATSDGKPKVHAHLVVATRDGTAHGGHLLEGYVRPTLEVILTETPRHLKRVKDPATGLALIDIDAEVEPHRRGRSPASET